MHDNRRIEALRQRLHSDPSPAAWAELQPLIERLQAGGEHVALDYTLTHLRAWPAHMRGLTLDAAQLAPTLHAPPPAWWPALGALTCLGDLDPDTAALIARSPRLDHLAALDLSGGHIGEAGALRWTQAPLRPALRALSLPRNALGDAGLRALAASPLLAHLTRLDLAYNRLTSDSGDALAQADPLWHTLTDLDLSLNPIGDAGLRLLADRRRLASLASLNLRALNLTADALDALLPSLTPGRLRALDLSYNPLGDAGAALLARAPALDALTDLKLHACDITPAGLHALLHARSLSPHVAARAVYREVLRNGDGLDGVDHWHVLQNGGNGWRAERHPDKDCPQTRNDANLVGSYDWFRASQTIDLLRAGFTPQHLDAAPTIEASEWICARSDAKSVYQLTVELLDHRHAPLAAFDTGVIPAPLLPHWRHPWTRVAHTFRRYGPGLRHIRFTHASKDATFWQGHYGAKMTGASVLIQAHPTHDDP